MADYGFDIGSYRPVKSQPGPPPTLGHYRRDHGIRTFTVHCLNGVRCWNKATLTFDDLSDDTVAKTLDARMVCTECGLIGADVRPDWGSRPLKEYSR
jgi:hypothetical protein